MEENSCKSCKHAIGNIYEQILCTRHIDLKINKTEDKKIPDWCPEKEFDMLKYIKSC